MSLSWCEKFASAAGTEKHLHQTKTKLLPPSVSNSTFNWHAGEGKSARDPRLFPSSSMSNACCELRLGWTLDCPAVTCLLVVTCCSVYIYTSAALLLRINQPNVSPPPPPSATRPPANNTPAHAVNNNVNSPTAHKRHLKHRLVCCVAQRVCVFVIVRVWVCLWVRV